MITKSEALQRLKKALSEGTHGMLHLLAGQAGIGTSDSEWQAWEDAATGIGAALDLESDSTAARQAKELRAFLRDPSFTSPPTGDHAGESVALAATITRLETELAGREPIVRHLATLKQRRAELEERVSQLTTRLQEIRHHLSSLPQ